MARKRTAPTTGTTDHPTTAGSAPRTRHPRTEAEYLAEIPLTPVTDEEFRAAYDGHSRECLKTGLCACNPFEDAPREIRPEERRAVRWWRQHLAHDRHLAAKRAAA